jgi:hypothetical protein
MEIKENWVKTAVGAVVVAAFFGVVWSWLFSCLITTFMKDDVTFAGILPFGLVFGALIAGVGVYLRTVPYKMISESVRMDDRSAFLPELERALTKAGYVPEKKSGSEDVRVYECAQSLDSLYKRKVMVQLAEDTATLVGPKASLKRVRKVLQASG